MTTKSHLKIKKNQNFHHLCQLILNVNPRKETVYKINTNFNKLEYDEKAFHTKFAFHSSMDQIGTRKKRIIEFIKK